jgi:hypothetical protein
MLYAFESDEEFENTTQQIDVLIRRHPEQSSWLLFVKEIKTSSVEHLFVDQEYHQITIVLRHPLTQHVIAEFMLQTSLEAPLYPVVPPVLKWLRPRYSFSDLLGLEFIDTLLPKKWNLCVNLMEDVILKIKEFVTPLSIESPELIYSEIEQFVISFVDFTGMYPCKFDSTMPCFGITKTKPKTDMGIGYGSGAVIGTMQDYHDYWKQHRDLLVRLVDILKADEPTSALDVTVQAQIIHLIQ